MQRVVSKFSSYYYCQIMKSICGIEFSFLEHFWLILSSTLKLIFRFLAFKSYTKYEIKCVEWLVVKEVIWPAGCVLPSVTRDAF